MKDRVKRKKKNVKWLNPNSNITLYCATNPNIRHSMLLFVFCLYDKSIDYQIGWELNSESKSQTKANVKATHRCPLIPVTTVLTVDCLYKLQQFVQFKLF